MKYNMKDFIYNIGDVICDENRNLTIIDREVRRNKRNDPYKYYKYRCNIDGNEHWILQDNLRKGVGCNICKNRRNKERFSSVNIKDSIGKNYPSIAKMIAISENNLTLEHTYKIAIHSNQKFYFKCPECGKISSTKKQLSTIMQQRFSCEYCSDGISLPNKVIRSVLTVLGVDYICEYSPEYLNRRKSDVFIPKMNLIIEMDGTRGHQTTDELKIDDWKDTQHLKHGIHTIRVKCFDNYDTNPFKCIKENILKELNDYFDLSNINWNEVALQSSKSFMIQAKQLYEQFNYTVSQISDILKISKDAVRRYLKQTSEQYCADISGKVVLLNNKQIFNSTKEAAKFVGIKSYANICCCCTGSQYYSGTYGREHAVWMYYKDYINATDEEIANKLNKGLNR